MSFRRSKAGRLLASVSLVSLLAACAVTPQGFSSEQLIAQGQADRDEMFQKGEALSGELTVSEAIARALKYNLDAKSKMMEEALALGQTKLDRWDMLPKLIANAGYNGRSKPNATKSRDLYTQATTSANPTYSADRDAITADLSMSWNVLDFGVSYFTARQNADRALIATERRRKAIHSLVSDVRYAFWRAAAYQELKESVDQAVDEAKNALERAKIVERENLKAPAEALRYQKSLLETLRQLTLVQQELSTASFELAAMIDLPPGTDIKLAVPADMKIPAWSMTVEGMEERAFLDNPDLREQGYLGRIAVNDTRKAILKLFPGVTFTGGRHYDHNSFLVDNRWYEAGGKISWSLINLLSAPDVIKNADNNEEVAKARRLALRMSVLAQVHVAERQFRNAVSQFQQSDELWRVDRRLSELSDARTANDAQGMLERVASHTSAIASQLRRFQTYAQVEQAYAKMQATIGHDLMPETVASTNLSDLTRLVAARLGEWGVEDGGVSADIPVALPEAAAVAPPQASIGSGDDVLRSITRWFAPKSPDEWLHAKTTPPSKPQDESVAQSGQ